MVDVYYTDSFVKSVKKINDASLKLKVKNQIKKIVNSPQIGKPMMYARKGTQVSFVTAFLIP